MSDQFTINNTVSASMTVAALTYAHTNVGAWHVTEIPSGNTLTVSGTTIVGGVNTNGVSTSVAMNGGGTFLATGTAFALGNTAGSGSQTPGNLDLSGLSNFVYSATGGTLGIGRLTTGTGSRSSGVLTLAAISNSITASTIDMNGATGTGSTPTLNAGAGTNVINVNTFNVGGGRSTAALQFATATGGLRLRGTGGTDNDRTTMTVGNRNTGGTGNLTTTGNVLFNAHPVDLKLATLTLGLMSRSGTEANFVAVGNFQFDQGTVNATTITMGVCSGNSPTSKANGTLTVGAAGTLSAGTISLANLSSGVAGQASMGTLNILGGEVNCVGDIIKTTATTSTGVVSVASSGTLEVGGSLGSANNPIDSLTLSDSTLTLRAAAAAPANVVTLTLGGATNVINVSSFPAITAYPAQFQVIKYADAIAGSSFDNNVGLGTLPAASPAFQGYLSNNTSTLTVDLVITGGPPPAQPITWAGAQSGAWDTSTFNWLAGATPTNYNNAGDFVTFDDNAGTSTVYLVTETLTPGSLTVNNSSLTYTFTGSGKLSGVTGLAKQGSGTLVLDNTGVNDFAGPVSITGTLQIGTGGTSGNLPPSASITDNGTLIFNRSDNFTAANAISGTGALVKNGANTLTLSGVSSYSGGVTVNNGTLRTGNINALGSGSPVTVNAGGTLVLGAVHTNSVVLAGGTLGTSVSLNPTPMEVTAAAATTSTVYMADPQNLAAPTDGIEVNFTNSWHGSGTILVATVLNDASPDGGNGFRLRSPNASDFSGTIIFSNRIKGELQTTVAGPFSPAGTGKIVLYGGVLTNNTLNGTYSELNLRNNSAGATVLGNDVEMAGSGIAVIDPLGSAPAGSTVTLGNLKIGGGQELGVNLNGSGPDHPVVFQSVTLTGGDATFSPKTSGWNTTPQIGSDLVLNNIGESAASGLIMNGLRTLTLTGNNNYSGNTVVSNGTLVINGSNLGAGSVTVYAGLLGGTGLISGPVTIGSTGTLAPGTSTGTLTVANTLTLSGTNVMELNKSGTTLTSDQVAGITTLHCGGTLVLNLTGDALAAGDKFKLYGFTAADGAFAAISPAVPGTDLLWNTNNLVTDGTLEVVSAVVPQPYIQNITITGTDVIISGTNAAVGGSYYVLSSTNVALPVTSWTPIATQAFNGFSFSFTNAITPGETQRYYLLQVP